MSIKIIKYPNPILQKQSSLLTDESEVQTLKIFLKHTAQAINCLGLAAPQIGFNKTIFYIKESDYFDSDFFVINPILLETSDETNSLEEGCLSLSKTYITERPNQILVSFHNDILNNVTTLFLSGMQARIFLHELDHLNGHLISDTKNEV